MENFDILVSGSDTCTYMCQIKGVAVQIQKVTGYFAGLTMDSNEHASSSSIPFMLTGTPSIHFEVKQDDLSQFFNQFYMIY